MKQKFKTKQSLINKIASSNRMPNQMKNTLIKNYREAEDESASYTYFTTDQIKSDASLQLNAAKNFAIKNIQSNQLKKKYPNQEYADITKFKYKTKRNQIKKAFVNKPSTVICTFEKNQAGAKLMSINRIHKQSLRSSVKNPLSVSKIFTNLVQAIKKAIPLNWQVYIVFIGGGIIIILSFFLVMFGALFGGDNGTTYGGAFIMPFDNSASISVTDDYGWRIHPITGERTFHYGIDYGTPWHCEIKAIAIGEVIYADNYGTYGNTVIIKHEIYGDILYSMYAHLSDIKVKDGQMIMQGEVIGLEGGDPNLDPNPGSSTGHHLHFGMMNKEMHFENPSNYLVRNK